MVNASRAMYASENVEVAGHKTEHASGGRQELPRLDSLKAAAVIEALL